MTTDTLSVDASTAGEAPAAASDPATPGAAEPAPAADGVRTYRGETIEELLPRIRAELGPDAVVVGRREGLTGGIGGFFQRRCVEVDARPGGPRVDLYDEEPPPVRNDAATREGLASPGVRTMIDQAQPFAALLDELAPTGRPAAPDAGVPDPGAPDPGAPDAAADELAGADAPAPPGPAAVAAGEPGGRRAATVRERLVATGLGDDLAADLVAATVASRLPFSTPGRMRTLVRDELAARLEVAPAAAPGPRALAIVGPAGAGKTAAVAALARAHAAALAAADGDAAGLAAEVVAIALDPADGGAALRAHLAGAGVEPLVLDGAGVDGELAERLARALVVVDTPPAWAASPDIARLARRLRELGVDEVHLALRADAGRQAAAELIEGLARLRPNRLLPTGVAATAHLGGVADAALRHGLALGYVADGPGELAPADAHALAARILTQR